MFVSSVAESATPSLTSLRAGDELVGVYACTRKDRLTARTGTPYLALELRDRTGALPARDRARRGGRPGGVPAGRLPRPRRARRLPRAPGARGPRSRVRSAAGGPAVRPRAARRVAAGAVHPGRPSRLSRRAARAHRGRGDARPGGLPAAPAAELRPAAVRRAGARPRQDARVHLRGGDRALRGGPAARPSRTGAAAARRVGG